MFGGVSGGGIKTVMAKRRMLILTLLVPITITRNKNEHTEMMTTMIEY